MYVSIGWRRRAGFARKDALLKAIGEPDTTPSPTRALPSLTLSNRDGTNSSGQSVES